MSGILSDNSTKILTLNKNSLKIREIQITTLTFMVGLGNT